MKKKSLFVLISLLFVSFYSFAQDVDLQLHFIPGHALHSDVMPRNFLRGTVEFTKVDKWGSTYMFVDLYFNQTKSNFSEAYTEIHRDFKIKKFPIMPHIEYNGGVMAVPGGSSVNIENAYLFGAAYEHVIKGIYFNTYIAYKLNAFQRNSHDIQWTISWNASYFKNKLTASGFVDVWTENKNKGYGDGPKGKQVVLYSKPQFWYNFTSHISLGTEIEISNNFYRTFRDRPYINPTIAAKWKF